MMPLNRRSTVLLAVTCLLLVSVFAAYIGRGSRAVSRSPAGVEDAVTRRAGAAQPSAAVVPVRAAAPRLSSPTAPLPPPATVSGNPDEQAARLVEQMMAGGHEAVSALVATLQKSGFPVRDADGRIVLEPAGQSQGIVFELWEVNALADLVADRQAVAAPLDSVAQALASSLPQLKDAPMTDLLLAGVRRHATGADTPLSFWSLIIVELGRQARRHDPYDLLGTVDPKQTHLDSIQIALITKRLAADLAAFSNPDKTKKQAFAPRWSLIPAVHAAGPPCGYEGVEAEIRDWMATVVTTAFGELLDYLDGLEVGGAERLSTIMNFANLVATYAKLAITIATFDIGFEMDGGPPLIRTTEVRPAAGQKRTVTATARMDTGNLQWVNCFRFMLNQMGIDFDVENDGPIAEATVSWRGIAGFSEAARYSGGMEQIVRFVGDPGQRIQSGGSFGGQNAVLNQPTDKEGRARIDVEGVGQRRALGREPKPVMKEVTLGAQVVLKPANMYRDLKDAVSQLPSGPAAMLTLPAEMLYRTTWAFGGTYTFPVQDWIEGNGWFGTLTYERTERRAERDTRRSTCCGGRPVDFINEFLLEEMRSQQWEIESGQADLLTPGFAMATANYSATASDKKIENSSHTGWASCRGGARPPTFTAHHRAVNSRLAYSGSTQVTISVDRDGSYHISSVGPEREPEGETEVLTADERNDGCNGARPTKTNRATAPYRAGNWGISMNGKVDPEHSDVLTGSFTRIERFERINSTIRHVYRWNLRR